MGHVYKKGEDMLYYLIEEAVQGSGTGGEDKSMRVEGFTRSGGEGLGFR